ncbi:AraC family transcriptional regulator [Halomonas alkaliantarctica]|uniref:AraC family transcriptional regulator n=1 Tax=Halomonas alkaliantarctica TaxID=232346 RepID=A0ABY8LRD0_9GAMM|nr:AraC family transcriptional regulator [Halomonas alkaliantarctica]WGI26986.1 AraC family transcriptional regulator [Halomonas alkaliantarctica]
MVDLSNVERLHSILETIPSYQMGLHSHEDHTMLLFPTWGTFKVAADEFDTHRWTMQSNVLIIPAGICHKTLSITQKQRHIAIYLHKDFEEYLLKHSGLGSKHTRSGVWQLSKDATVLLGVLERNLDNKSGNLANKCSDIADILIQDCLARSIISRDTGTSLVAEHGRHIAHAVINSLTEDLSMDVDLDLLSSKLGISRRHLTRLFREHTGYSIGEIHLKLRFREAKRLLSSTDLSIQLIALEVGFENASSFTRAFRRHLGCTPREIRMARSAQS